MKRTMFLVTIHGSPIGPVPVPFTQCGNILTFFPRLIKERGVPNEDARKINDITTIFNWTGGEYGGRVGGIRKNMPCQQTGFISAIVYAMLMRWMRAGSRAYVRSPSNYISVMGTESIVEDKVVKQP